MCDCNRSCRCKKPCSAVEKCCDTLRYEGPDIPCAQVVSGESYESVVRKLSEKLCDLEGLVNELIEV